MRSNKIVKVQCDMRPGCLRKMDDMYRVSGYEKHTILFTIIYEREVYPVQTFPGQYYSLMNLISDYLGIPGFGLCCGMGSCGTCMVKIDGIPYLSCEVQVSDELANTTIVIEEGFF